ncbi:MAG TPA: hypothetical protein VGW31_13350 [Hanamia sp.]|nr:hypothetical protein [Hanamia sp.]
MANVISKNKYSMHKTGLLILSFLFLFFLNSCSKKSHPTKTPVATVEYDYTPTEIKKTPPETETKTETRVVARNPKAVIPKVITVNDAAAHKSVDGRLYYDVEGRRYWRNNKDGKYYLFNKSMYNDPAFKKID